MTDIQSQQLVVSEAFTSRVLRDMVDILKQDLRNLRNDELSLYHPKSFELSADVIESMYDDDVALREDAGLPVASIDRFTNQIKPSAPKLTFSNILESAGIELEYVDDVVKDSLDNNPYRDDRAAFLYQEDAINTPTETPAIVAELLNDPVLSEQIYTDGNTSHIVERPAELVIETNPSARENLERVLEYVRQYVR